MPNFSLHTTEISLPSSELAVPNKAWVSAWKGVGALPCAPVSALGTIAALYICYFFFFSFFNFRAISAAYGGSQARAESEL